MIGEERGCSLKEYRLYVREGEYLDIIKRGALCRNRDVFSRKGFTIPQEIEHLWMHGRAGTKSRPAPSGLRI